ncbi:hypothetical protein M2167_000420 [Streptomyces sp. SPB4]|nr:hypothetical protein [Streptomyces sp. SPB4]
MHSAIVKATKPATAVVLDAAVPVAEPASSCCG